jgi:hypothetical protein
MIEKEKASIKDISSEFLQSEVGSDVLDAESLAAELAVRNAATLGLERIERVIAQLANLTHQADNLAADIEAEQQGVVGRPRAYHPRIDFDGETNRLMERLP